LATSRHACPSMSREECKSRLQIPSDLAEGTRPKPLGRKVTTHSSAASVLALGESFTGTFPPRDPVSIPADAWQVLSSGLMQVLSMLSGHGASPRQGAASLPLPVQAVVSPTAASGCLVPGASGSAVPSTSGGVSGLQIPAASFPQHHASSSEEEGEADFDLMSSSSVEEKDDSQSLHWSDVVSAIRVFHPEAVAADGASSAVRRAWSAPGWSTP
jgi:hypothetical protein